MACALSFAAGSRAISKPFTIEERKRFRNLLELAKSSPFEGERNNALDAAKRMAGRNGMSLEEAAAYQPPAPEQVPEYPKKTHEEWLREQEFIRAAGLMEYKLRMDKLRREEALRAARRRGLDAEEETAKAKRSPNLRTARSRVRMDPRRHAQILLAETSFPFDEIAGITGLDIYQVVEEKLKLRKSF